MTNIYSTGERIRKAREYKGLSRRDLEKATGIEDYKWNAIEGGRQRPNDEHLSALGNIWPEYKLWLAYGETLPQAGQISPELEETGQKLLKVG
jgi:transcriptional regulator with XRE-family HTH domain